jgi:hypothetical protein
MSDNLHCERSGNLVSKYKSIAYVEYSVSLRCRVTVTETNLPVGVLLDAAASNRPSPTLFLRLSEAAVLGLRPQHVYHCRPSW